MHNGWQTNVKAGWKVIKYLAGIIPKRMYTSNGRWLKWIKKLKLWCISCTELLLNVWYIQKGMNSCFIILLKGGFSQKEFKE